MFMVFALKQIITQKVAQLAKLPCHGGGPDSEAVIRAETGKRSIIASLKSHGKGLDGLQLKFFKQLFPEIPSSNRVMEQVLGRLVRRGQKSDEVLSWYYDHVLEFRESMRRVKARAEFNQSMQNPALILSAIFEDD
jgi:superfamily II DNA or RNA helicase